jgi:hypothetical protein
MPYTSDSYPRHNRTLSSRMAAATKPDLLRLQAKLSEKADGRLAQAALGLNRKPRTLQVILYSNV